MEVSVTLLGQSLPDTLRKVESQGHYVELKPSLLIHLSKTKHQNKILRGFHLTGLNSLLAPKPHPRRLFQNLLYLFYVLPIWDTHDGWITATA